MHITQQYKQNIDEDFVRRDQNRPNQSIPKEDGQPIQTSNSVSKNRPTSVAFDKP